jgi:hypothetical protein
MTLHLQSALVATGHDEDGMLVFDENHRLLAVLVRLGEEHETPGYWFLEAGLGRIHAVVPPAFASLDEAQEWIDARRRG